MNEGWDDDLEDLVDDDDESETEGGGGLLNKASSPNPVRATGGWEEDEELFGVDDENVAAPEPMKNDNENVENESGQGWGDDEEVLDFGYDWGDNNDAGDDSDISPQMPSERRTPSPFGEDLPETTKAAVDVSAGGWEEDEELFDDAIDDTNVEQLPPPPPPRPPNRNVLTELEEYVGSLGRMLSSVNAVLEFEYNTPEKAAELMQYYSERSGLAEYTRTKEVPRMNYQVILPDGSVETNKQSISQNHLPDHSIIARAANQSLLADLLHVLTGSDMVVRPQFLAICVAQTCQFRLHYGDQGRDMLHVNCMLQVSLPVAEGPRLNIATIRATVVFSPRENEHPMVRFKVDKIIVLLKEAGYSKLQQVVEFLQMVEGHFDEIPGHEDLAMQNAPAGVFRDAFLEQSQQLMNLSKAGMQSALKEMEAVIGLRSKFKAVRGGLSKFLPDTAVMLAAEEEARALAAAREARQQQQHALMQSSRPPPPPSSPRLATPGDVTARPQSILGGLVKSGWGALAKSIAVPDDDPAIYGEAPKGQPPTSFDRKEEASHSRQQTTPSAPSLYIREDKPSVPHPAPGFPKNVDNNPVPQSTISKFGQDEFSGSGLHESAPSPEQNEKVRRPLMGSHYSPEAQQESSKGLAAIALDPSFGEEFGDCWEDELDLIADIDDGVGNHAKSQQEAPAVADAVNTTKIEVITDNATPSEKNGEPIAASMNRSSPSKIPAYTGPGGSGSKSISPPKGDRSASKIPAFPMTSPRSTENENNEKSGAPKAQESLKPSEPVPSASENMLIDTTKIDEVRTATFTKLPKMRSLLADISYNPEDDVIPTRKRWLNPRPDRFYLA